MHEFVSFYPFAQWKSPEYVRLKTFLKYFTKVLQLYVKNKLHYHIQKYFQLWQLLFLTILTSSFLSLIIQVFATFYVNFTAQKMKFSIKD